MNIDELYLNINDSTMADIVRQVEVRTEEDVQQHQKQGYLVRLTEAAFRERFPQVNPEHICFIPSFSLSCFYFNPETLVVCPFNLDALLREDIHAISIDKVCEEIARRERKATAGNYLSSLMTLTDRMRLEYFTMLVEKYGTSLPNLYRTFFDAYTTSDYGFRGLDKEAFSKIIQSKTEADKQQTAAAVKDLPDVVTIYRGGNTESTAFQDAYSWTLDINTANFFACRRGRGPGYIVEGQVEKEHIIDAFLDNRNEQEIIVDPAQVRIIKSIRIHGASLLKKVLPNVTPVFQTYRDALCELRFTHESDIHGKNHEARVMLLTQIISELMGLPLYERKLLATAAIYHDTCRTHDGEDADHGERASAYYASNVSNPNYLVEFLCKYHSLPDEMGYEAIRNNRKLSRNRMRATLLLQIFKDADALDRIRLGGIKALDLNQLRLDVSKKLTLVAKMGLEQIKV